MDSEASEEPKRKKKVRITDPERRNQILALKRKQRKLIAMMIANLKAASREYEQRHRPSDN